MPQRPPSSSRTPPSPAAVLAGRRFADGAYTVTRAADDELRRLIDGPPSPPGIAHPVWAHLATHIGKSVSFTAFAELVGASLDAGFLFGGGVLEWASDIELERRYLVRGGIDTVEARTGARTGPFELITTGLELTDPDSGTVVSRSRETYVVPRGGA